jgi:hypothetical protein
MAIARLVLADGHMRMVTSGTCKGAGRMSSTRRKILKLYVNPIDCVGGWRHTSTSIDHFSAGAPDNRGRRLSVGQSLSWASFVGRVQELEALQAGVQDVLAGR